MRNHTVTKKVNPKVLKPKFIKKNIDVQSNPVDIKFQDKVIYFKVDVYTEFNGLILIAGWRTAQFQLQININGENQLAKEIKFERCDVNEHFDLLAKFKSGFVYIVRKKELLNDDFEVSIEWKNHQDLIESSHFLVEFDGALIDEDLEIKFGPVYQNLINQPKIKKDDFKVLDLITKNQLINFSSASWIEPDFIKANGFIDVFGVVPGKKGVLAGWAICRPGWKIWAQDDQGLLYSLDSSLRYYRDDISNLFSQHYGQHAEEAGFICQWSKALSSDACVTLLAYHHENNIAFKIHQINPIEISDDPVSYAKWSLSLHTPSDKFNDRLEQGEGDFLEELLIERKDWIDKNLKKPKVWTFGDPVNVPKISIIIPLYGRWDFIEHQLLEFSQDKKLLEVAEFIYVVDDPKILTLIINESETLYKLYEVPFKIVWGYRNRGFAGANNLGFYVSKGKHIIFINSDVFPNKPGWANRLVELLQLNSEFGILGARLLNPEGGLQHAGMNFVFSSLWEVWLNKHPLSGLSPELDHVSKNKTIVEKHAVTGACMAISRELYFEISGFDECYLIGDFEDSDLCLKVLERGFKVGYVPEVNLTYLERQSFSDIGDMTFRTFVVRFNAWRHTRKWGNKIQILTESIKARGFTS